MWKEGGDREEKQTQEGENKGDRRVKMCSPGLIQDIKLKSNWVG